METFNEKFVDYVVDKDAEFIKYLINDDSSKANREENTSDEIMITDGAYGGHYNKQLAEEKIVKFVT